MRTNRIFNQSVQKAAMEADGSRGLAASVPSSLLPCSGKFREGMWGTSRSHRQTGSGWLTVGSQEPSHWHTQGDRAGQRRSGSRQPPVAAAASVTLHRFNNRFSVKRRWVWRRAVTFTIQKLFTDCLAYFNCHYLTLTAWFKGCCR